MKNKKLVIISGVTGAIGSLFLAEFAQEENTIVYGISRKAPSISDFLRNGHLPHASLICSIGDSLVDGYAQLAGNINFEGIDEVVYVHALGLYPFEINHTGDYVVENDHDNDGINDAVIELTYKAFVSAFSEIRKKYKGQLKCVIFGGLADVHKPLVHQSWWRTFERTKAFMQEKADEKTLLMVANISSVLCPHELITRPFVFIETDANPAYWLYAGL